MLKKNKVRGGYHNAEFFLTDELCERLRKEKKKDGFTKTVRIPGSYTVEDIIEICGCSKRTWERFATTLSHEFPLSAYDEKTLKKFQLWLKGNQAKQGAGSEIVKKEVSKDIVISAAVHESKDLAVDEIIKSGNVEAMKCPMAHYVNETKAVEDRRKLQEENLELRIDNRILELENKELRHRTEYDQMIKFRPWNQVKKDAGIKDSFYNVRLKCRLTEGIDFVEKCMGFDVWPTKMISPEAVELIKNFYKTTEG